MCRMKKTLSRRKENPTYIVENKNTRNVNLETKSHLLALSVMIFVRAIELGVETGRTDRTRSRDVSAKTIGGNIHRSEIDGSKVSRYFY